MRAFSEACLWGLTLSAAGLCACFTSFEVECGVDAHCNRLSGGLCHTNPQTDRRWCSYPDPTCSHGYRYSDLDVGDGVSGACTGEAPARCDPTADFGEPTLVPNVNTSLDDIGMTMTRDELLAVFVRIDGASLQLLTSTRTSTSVEFPPPRSDPKLTPLTAVLDQVFTPSLTSDGLALYLSGYNSPDVYHVLVTTRDTQDNPFEEPSSVFVGSSPLQEAIQPSISADGQTLYWLDWYDFNLRSATRNRVNSFRGPMIISVVNIHYYVVSRDGLTLYYSDGFRTDILSATRDSQAAPFGANALVPNVNSSQEEVPLSITADGCLLYLSSNRPDGFGGSDIWVARRPR